MKPKGHKARCHCFGCKPAKRGSKRRNPSGRLVDRSQREAVCALLDPRTRRGCGRAKAARRRGRLPAAAYREARAARHAIPEDQIAAFDRVWRGLYEDKGRATLEEAFAEWTESNPEELARLQADYGDAATRKLLRAQERYDRMEREGLASNPGRRPKRPPVKRPRARPAKKRAPASMPFQVRDARGALLGSFSTRNEARHAAQRLSDARRVSLYVIGPKR